MTKVNFKNCNHTTAKKKLIKIKNLGLKTFFSTNSLRDLEASMPDGA